MTKKVVVSRVRLMIPSGLANAPEHMGEQWERTQKNVIDITEAKRDKIIPDEETYLTKMAGPSSANYAASVSPTFVSRAGKNRDGIVAAQNKNVCTGYKKYRKALDLLKATQEGIPAKRYQDKISAMRAVYSHRMAEITLPFTGEKTMGKSICSIAPQWLTGDSKVVEFLRGCDQLTGGGPVNVTKRGLRGALRAALSGQLLKCGVLIRRSDGAPNVITEENDLINSLIRGLQDETRYAAFTTGGESHCDFILDKDGLFFLEIQVTEIMP